MKNARTKKTESGLTKQRAVVLQVIREAKEHLTANEIFESARALLPGISFATVYNSLRYLKDVELIAEKNFGSGASRFDRMTERHDHAVCNRCGKLVDMELEMPEELVALAAEFSKFKPESIELTLRGLCPDCTK
jgi:Fur family ferric uptake transcriptional regulator/Fur family peroxide stress response transcriptional regulator